MQGRYDPPERPYENCPSLQSLWTEIEEFAGALVQEPEVQGVLITSRTGDIIFYEVDPETNPRKLGPMAAVLLGTAELLPIELRRGDLFYVAARCQSAGFMSVPGGAHIILSAVLSEEAEPANAFPRLRTTAERISSLLDKLQKPG